VAELQRAVHGTIGVVGELETRVAHLRQAALLTADDAAPWLQSIESIEDRLDALKVRLQGDSSVSRRNEPAAPSIQARLAQVVGGLWTSSSPPTASQRKNYEIVAAGFPAVLDEIRALAQIEMPKLEEGMEAVGAPWTPGRIPKWNE